MTQIKKLLSRVLCGAMVLCSVAACSSDSDEEGLQETGYTLDEIEWAFDANGVEVTETKIPEEIYKNNSNGEMPVTVCPVENFIQISQFYSDDPNSFQLLTQNAPKVCIPFGEMPFDGFFHTSGGPEVPLSLEEYTYSPHSYSTVTTKLPPYTILKFNATITERKVTAIYRARFTGNDSGKHIEITGKWYGVYYESREHAERIEEIK